MGQTCVPQQAISHSPSHHSPMELYHHAPLHLRTQTTGSQSSMSPFLTLLHLTPSPPQCAAAKGYWLRRPCKRKRSSSIALPLPIKPIKSPVKIHPRSCVSQPPKPYHFATSQYKQYKQIQCKNPLQSTPPSPLIVRRRTLFY